MKRTLLSLLLPLMCMAAMQAQDLITLRDGTDIEAQVLQVSPDEIKYKRTDNPDGPEFFLPTADVLLIRYANGANQVFDQARKPATRAPSPYDIYGSVDYGTTDLVAPGMRYREYQNLYRPSSYIRLPGDPYSPALSGVCSWLIPGLGQMLCDEVGRGFGYLGGAFGCSVLTVIGAAIMYDNPDAGATLAVCGSLGMLTIDICAIVDGVRVAKVKNMYEQDLRRQQLSSTLDVRLQPYVSSLSTATVRTPVAGVSLAVSF